MKSLDQVTFRWLRRDETKAGMAAIRRLWRKTHILGHDEELFRWQYMHGHDDEHLGMIVAEAGGEIVAFSGLVLLPYHIYGKPVSGGLGSITIVEPSWRELGLGLRLIPEADRNLDIIGSVGIARRISVVFRLQGRHVFEAFPRRLGLGNDKAVAAYLDLAGYTADESKRVKSECSRVHEIKSDSSIKMEPLSSDNLPEWDETWHKYFAPHLIGVSKEASYLEWRYLQHPWFKYECYLARDGKGDVAGLAVWRIVELGQGLHCVRILDFLPANPVSGKAMAAFIAERAPEDFAYMEHCALGKKGEILSEIGLDKNGAGLVSVYTSPPDKNYCALPSAYLVHKENVGLEPAAFVNHPDCYLTLADSDQDRPNVEVG